MKSLSLFMLSLMMATFAVSQNLVLADSLKRELAISKVDTSRVSVLMRLSAVYNRADPALSAAYAKEGLKISKSLNYTTGEGRCLMYIASAYQIQGRYPEAMEVRLRVNKIPYTLNGNQILFENLRGIGNIYSAQQDYKKAIEYFLQAKEVSKLEGAFPPSQQASLSMVMGNNYFYLNELDSASLYLKQAYDRAVDNNIGYLMDNILTGMGQVESARGNDKLSMSHFRNSIPYSLPDGDHSTLSQTYLLVAQRLRETGQKDSSIFYAKKALTEAEAVNHVPGIMAASQLLASVYEGFNDQQAFNYYKIAMRAKDSLFSGEKVKQMQNLEFVEQQRLQSIEAAKIEYRNNIKLYALVTAVGIFLLIAIMLFKNNSNKQKANRLLKHKNQQIEITLQELKTTQSQLVQREKMASLGELTAGIAHEIQNPLNFINNFSDVNIELAEDLQQEITNGNTGEANAIADHIKENERKINQHGKRADGIVKGMLQHSRGSAGQKQLVDINALADEYLRLSYHGFRAKDNLFNASLVTNFDQTLGSIYVIPQDIGSVLLNLFNNAFYSVNEKKKALNGTFEPAVSVATEREGNTLKITITDNGKGIPQIAINKIYQPFFTTKPAGQGTGLGLSLSYDIITKGHGGELKVETREGEYAAFEIRLPFMNEEN